MTRLVNARLLTMDPEAGEIERGWLAVADGRIAALGAGDPPGGPEPGDEDMQGDLVCPGFVNTHAHLAMTLFRGLGEDVDDRLFRYILPLERALVTAEVVEIGTRLAALESIRAGVTTIADMYYHEDRVGTVLEAAGLRGLLGQTLADFDAPDHDGWDAGFARLDALHDAYRDHPRLAASAAPHAPYSTGPAAMARVADWAAAHPGTRVQMHLAETREEVAWAEREHGRTTIEVTRDAGLLTPALTAAHVMYPTAADIDLIADSGAGVAHNARSNGKAGRGIAPVAALHACGVPVGLATDGPMSGNTLDLFAQMAPASMFQKIAAGTRRVLPAAEIVRMATLGGAEALGMADEIGSLAPGKAADLIRIDTSDPRWQPIYDIRAALVFSALPCDVRATMVAGSWLMRDRVVATVEAPRALADARRVADTFRARIVALDAARA